MQKIDSGHLHPITRVIWETTLIFRELGFEAALGPEIETEWYNFDALNIPFDHPARDMQDTFWIKARINADTGYGLTQMRNANDGRGLNISGNQRGNPRKSALLLRTHTSPVQIRHMESKLKKGIAPPYRIIAPGKVFRNEATDATHEAQFFQVEGLYVDKNVSLAHLKGTLEFFFAKFFGQDVETQFRPSFFAFTEPSAEVWMRRKGRWLEMAGAGLVHPNVLRAVNLDPKEYSGFAFGLSIDRSVMLKYGIPDIRMFYSGDLRLVNQF